MPPFKWEDIDHGLVGLKFTNLSEQMHQQIEADERRIQFENLGNLNSLAVPSLILEMKERRTEEFVQKVYELYCDVWHTQGRKKSAAFLRAVYGGGMLPVLRAQAGSITSEFAMFARRTNFPSQVRDATLQGLGLRMKRLEARWLRRIEAEAKECEHIDRREIAGDQSKPIDFSAANVVSGASASAPGENSPASVQQIGAKAAEGRPIPALTVKSAGSDNVHREAVIRKVRTPQAYTVLSVPEVALYFEVKPRTVYRWIEERKLAYGGRRGSVTIESIVRFEKKRSRKRQNL
jgi:helix-turn-helix protein